MKILQKRYKLLKTVGSDTTGQVFLAKDLEATDDPLRIIQWLDLTHEDSSLTEFGLMLLAHKAQALIAVLSQISSANKIFDYFVEGHHFYVVVALVRGITVTKFPLNIEVKAASPDQRVQELLREALAILNDVYAWGLASCCLYPTDLILNKANGRLIWTGLGIFKAVCQQIYYSQSNIATEALKEVRAYFAPEFLRGEFHAGSDLYTLGVLGIQGLTQRSLNDLIETRDDPSHPILKTNWHRWAKVQPELVAILNRMVEPDYRCRYQSVTDVLHDLQASYHPVG